MRCAATTILVVVAAFWSKPLISGLDRQLGERLYIAIRQLSNVRTAPQVTKMKALLLPTPGVLPNSRFHHRWRETDSLVATQSARIDLVAIDICDQPEVSAT